MLDLMALVMSDIRYSIEHLEISDFVMPVLYGFWAVIWLFPLKGIDRHDRFAALDFICFLCLAATILIFALPQSFNNQTMDWKQYSTAMMIVIFLGAARWLFHMNAHSTVVVKANVKKESSRG